MWNIGSNGEVFDYFFYLKIHQKELKTILMVQGFLVFFFFLILFLVITAFHTDTLFQAGEVCLDPQEPVRWTWLSTHKSSLER